MIFLTVFSYSDQIEFGKIIKTTSFAKIIMGVVLTVKNRIQNQVQHASMISLLKFYTAHPL